VNKEKIKAKMLKSATQLWGVQSSDIAAFDPIVDLLLGACAVELEKVYNEIYSSNARILERLSKLLLPDINKNTLPSHGILHASPYDENIIINKYAQFFYTKKVQAKESSVRENSKDIYFSPVADFPLVNGEIEYMGTNTGLYSVDNLLYKERKIRSSGKKVNTKFLWVGLKVNRIDNPPDSLILYFDWLNNPLKEKYLDFLAFTKWYHNGVDIKLSQGIDNSMLSDSAESHFNYDNEFVETQKILSTYRKRYVSIPFNQLFKTGNSIFSKYPEEFSYLYEAGELKALNEELLWIKIVFPPFVSEDIIDTLICQMNCFPVMNRKLNELTFRLHDADTFNIIPLKDRNDDASFFSMESVKSSDGLPYISSSISDLNQLNNGNYVIRKGGVQRFDVRNAREYLSYMIDLLRDESAEFSVYGQEMLNTNLKELSQLIALIEQKIQYTHSDELYSLDYLILRSFQNQDNVHIEYWSTAGDFANNIRVSSSLNLYSGADVNSGDIVIISETTGGRSELTASEMLTAFKQSLVSRERIVTIADIRNVCYSELGGLIKDVRVTKEFVIDSKSTTGFMRVIRIELYPTTFNMSDDDWSIHKLRLQSIIETSSFSNTPVEIVVAK
jgi:hypothetical protein